MSASPTRAPRRCTSWPPWTTCPRCGPCSRSSKGWPRAPPTATAGWPDGRPPRCCTSARASATASPTCTTPGGPARPIVNVVGDHATYHQRYDPPLESDIDSLARPVSGWYRVGRLGRRTWPTTRSTPWPPPTAPRVGWPPWWCRPTCRGRRPRRGARHSARGPAHGGRRTEDRGGGHGSCPAPSPPPCSSGARPARPGLAAASRVAAPAGPPCCSRRSRPPRARRRAPGPSERLGYLAELAQAQLAGARHLVLVEAAAPVVVLRLPGPARRPASRGVRVRDPRRGRVTTPPAHCSRPGRAPGALADGARAGAVGTARAHRRDRSAPSRPSPRPSAPSCPRAPSWSTRPTPRGIFVPGATAGAPRTTGSA